MKISIIGSGYVGMVTGTCFAELGNVVTFLDIDTQKIAAINAAKSPIYELGLEEMLARNRSRIAATTDYNEAIHTTDITFLCVGTPCDDEGAIDLKYIRAASADLGRALRSKEERHTVIVKSTVLPGTTEQVVGPILEETSNTRAFGDFGLGSNPEFLREGVAVRDFMNPDRIVFGTGDEKTRAVLEELYATFSCPKLATSIKTAEMIKYTSNAFLATKISFANEIGNLCKHLGIDTGEVFAGVGLDARINPAFFRSGIGFGGSCFPKDVKALIAHAQSAGEAVDLLRSVIKVNDQQPLKTIHLLKKHIPDLRGATIGILGLAFKPDTDDIRESRAMPIIGALLAEGARIIAYDPLAETATKAIFPTIGYADSPDDALKVDAIIIATEWKEFEYLDYSGRIVIDGRNIERAKKEAAVYEGVCW
ncbi:MAG: UDP-glucose/GDP-mannose dehydrogenase family protein [Methanomicrobiaceae archaeon]|nr:UDP-glucose/GDP-mannose dehydrogenase family protein [Methanomicrobiaceae archaeon]